MGLSDHQHWNTFAEETGAADPAPAPLGVAKCDPLMGLLCACMYLETEWVDLGSALMREPKIPEPQIVRVGVTAGEP
jgi:hypothetical protein